MTSEIVVIIKTTMVYTIRLSSRVDLLSLIGGCLTGKHSHPNGHTKYSYLINVFCSRATCSQINITLRLEENISVPSTCFLSTRQRIIIYSACAASAIVLSFTRAILFYFICVNASRVLHNRMFASVLGAPVRFFDTNPIGD